MDREFFYPSEQPTDTMFLTAERAKVIALGYLAQAILGTGTIVDGFSCIPTVPASLSVQVGPGSIYSQTAVDNVAYGTLGTDTVDQIIKQGIILGYTSLTLTPPGTSGQAINYLIQAQLVEIDTNAVALSYFNSASPLVPFSGPAGSGVSQPTVRQSTVVLSALAGTAATAGSQTTPTPTAGYVGLYVVTVANGATQLTLTQISQYSAAPFIPAKLPLLPSWVQGGTYAWGVDIGTANAINVTLSPVPASITAGFEVWFKKLVTSTSGVTITINGASATTVTTVDGSALSSTVVMNAGVLIGLKFDGTVWRWMDAPVSTAVGSLTASSGEGVNVNGSAVVALNYPSLTVEPAVAPIDLWSFYSQADGHHRVQSWAQLVANLTAALPFPTLNAPLNYYVNPSTGLDTNNGLTAGTAFQTIQRALTATAGYNMNGYNVTINLATGTYAPFTSVPLNGSGSVIISGNLTTPANCFISATTGEAIWISHSGYLLQGIKVASAANGASPHYGSGLRSSSCNVSIYNIEFGACSWYHIHGEGGATVNILGSTSGSAYSSAFINISGSAAAHVSPNANSIVVIGSPILNVNAVVSFAGGFAAVSGGGLITGYYSAINNGSNASGYRYNISLNGVINSSGQASIWPGSVAGITTTGGQIL
jgi:hypothetical protein